MLSAHVGEDMFLRGVSAYLKNHRYGSTVSRDLWDAISASAGYDISTMMHTWVGQVRPGYSFGRSCT
jgi:aminopeptidase 2